MSQTPSSPKAPPPPSRKQTIRQTLAQALTEQPMDAKQISGRIGITEKEVADHLEHLQKSKSFHGKLQITPPQCRLCGFVFEARLSRPSRCPKCKGERLDPPSFFIPSSAS